MNTYDFLHIVNAIVAYIKIHPNKFYNAHTLSRSIGMNRRDVAYAIRYMGSNPNIKCKGEQIKWIGGEKSSHQKIKNP